MKHFLEIWEETLHQELSVSHNINAYRAISGTYHFVRYVSRTFGTDYLDDHVNAYGVYFHKSLRQTDVFDDGDLDMMLWQYMQLSGHTYEFALEKFNNQAKSIDDE